MLLQRSIDEPWKCERCPATDQHDCSPRLNSCSYLLDDPMTIEEDFLSELAQLAITMFVDQELARLQAKTAAFQTAKNAYLQALQKSLSVMGGSDTIKLS